nr:hypothetical protein [Zhaonella formicivorans]
MLYYGKMYFAVQICGVSGWRYIVLFVVENMKLPKFTKIICGWQGIQKALLYVKTAKTGSVIKHWKAANQKNPFSTAAGKQYNSNFAGEALTGTGHSG